MKLMSFDQSMSKSGWALFDYESKTLLDYGIIENLSYKSLTREDAIHKMASDLLYVAKSKEAELFSYEDVYLDTNRNRSNVQLPMLAGAIVGMFKSYNDSLIFPVAATKWKSYCGIKGKKREEQKKSTIEFVKNQFGIKTKEDICDAIAQGWTVVNTIKIKF